VSLTGLEEGQSVEEVKWRIEDLFWAVGQKIIKVSLRGFTTEPIVLNGKAAPIKGKLLRRLDTLSSGTRLSVETIGEAELTVTLLPSVGPSEIRSESSGYAPRKGRRPGPAFDLELGSPSEGDALDEFYDDAGLEEEAARERVREFLRVLGKEAQRGMIPILIGRSLQGEDARFRALAGLEEFGIYLDPGARERGSLFTQFVVGGYRHFLFAGLEEEGKALRPLADLSGMTFDAVLPQQFEKLFPLLMAQAAGLEQGAVEAREGFGQFMAGLEQLGSRA
jgi:hypothetical protein